MKMLARLVWKEHDRGRAQFLGGAMVEIDGCRDLDIGTTLLVDEDPPGHFDWEPTDQHWPIRPTAAKVAQVDEDQTVIQLGATFLLLPATSREIKPGDLVWYDDALGVLGVMNLDTPSEAEPIAGADEHVLTFDDFAGYPDLVRRARKRLDVSLKKGKELTALGAQPIRGVLFWGPPGTGKTLLARVIAQTEGAQFHLINGPEIVSKWLGDSEAEVREVFAKARRNIEPTIIFIDEIDSIAPARTDDTHEASKRLVAQLLTELDGFVSDNRTVVIGATNRPEDIDPALLRPGRLGWRVHFPLPDFSDRLALLQQLAKKGRQEHLEEELHNIASSTEGRSGAQLAAIWTEAALLAVAEGRSSLTSEDLTDGLYLVERDSK